MIEARAFINDLDPARTVLEQEHAEFKGFYKIHDAIYRNKITGVDISKEFLRLRHVPVNIWDEKSVIVAIKKTVLRNTGKISEVPTKIQFDNLNIAHEYVETQFGEIYERDFEFSRDGWQYVLPSGDVVDLEIVEDKYPTIELKSKSDSGIMSLVEKFNISQDQIITGPSVSAIRKILSISG